MSLAEVLTMEEKKKIIEAFGVEVAIQAFGVKKIIEAIGIEKGIQVVGTGKVFDAVGIEKVIEAIRVEKVINTLGRMLNLPEHEKKKLLMRYKKIKLNKK